MDVFWMGLLNFGSKLAVYLCSAGLIGGWFVWMLVGSLSVVRSFLRRYLFVAALVGFCVTGINFYAQVGSFAESGWAGMFDTDYQAMLWDSAVGDSVVLRVLGFALALLISVFFIRGHQAGANNNEQSDALWGRILLFGPVLLLSAAFVLIGHTVEQFSLVRFLLGLHVLIALLWMGALLPLWYACGVLEIKPLQQLMHYFGLWAAALVAVLLVCGVVIAWQLLGSPSELVTTTYGRMLLVKVTLVVVILGLAARHKFRLVPQLDGKTMAMKLRRSILIEVLIGLAILGVTVLLTTAVGPESLH